MSLTFKSILNVPVVSNEVRREALNTLSKLDASKSVIDAYAATLAKLGGAR